MRLAFYLNLEHGILKLAVNYTLGFHVLSHESSQNTGIIEFCFMVFYFVSILWPYPEVHIGITPDSEIKDLGRAQETIQDARDQS